MDEKFNLFLWGGWGLVRSSDVLCVGEGGWVWYDEFLGAFSGGVGERKYGG